MGENGAIKDRIKSLRRVRVSELHAHPKNFRKHAQGQRRAMSAALKEIGFADALLVRETPDGLQIIDGHLRADLAGDQKVPVLVLDVDEQEADKLLATFDAITGLAEIDEELLRSLTDGLEFETPELDELVAGLLGDEPADITEDDPPEAQDGPCVAQLGDVWACGRHMVVCGDCTVESHPAADAMLTDPPYGLGAGRYVGTSIKEAHWDDAEPFDLTKLPVSSMRSLIWGAQFYGDQPNALGLKTWSCWAKQLEYDGGGLLSSALELCCANFGRGAVWSVPWGPYQSAREGVAHPTAKPAKLIAKTIEVATKPGETVYDPFLGSGTTLIAAEQLGRTCYGIEIEPKYVDGILRRYMNFTNISPVRERDGVLFSELVKGEMTHV